MTATACAICEQTGRFPEGWEAAGPNDTPPIGTWAKSATCGLYRCSGCGALWSGCYDQYQAYYICNLLPVEIERSVHPDATPSDILGVIDVAAAHWLLEAYYRQATYDLTDASTVLIAVLGRDGSTENQTGCVLNALKVVFERAESSARRHPIMEPLIRLQDVRPLVRLIEREQLGRASDGKSLSSAQLLMTSSAHEILRHLLTPARPVIAISGDARHTLERLSGIRREALSRAKPLAESMIGADELVDVIQLELGKEVPSGRHVRSTISLLQGLGSESGRDARELRADYVRLLEQLRRTECVPDKLRAEVDGWIDRHGHPPKESAVPPKPTNRRRAVAGAAAPSPEQGGSESPKRREVKVEPEGGAGAVVLIAGSSALVLVSAGLLGEFLIPAGDFITSVLFLGALFLAAITLAFYCRSCRRTVTLCATSAIMIGSLLLGHYVAFAWNGEEWAARYFAQQQENSPSDFDWRARPRRELLNRMIAERLEEPGAGGPFDLLRLRAHVGSRQLVSQRWSTLPDRGKRYGWPMWATWITQVALAVAAIVALARLIPPDESDE